MKSSALIREVFGLARFNEYNALIDKARTDKKFVSKTPMVTNDVYVGIEVEVENVFHTQNLMNFTPDCPLWRLTEDGSLRNHGKEYVSTPLKGDNIPFALDVLHNHLTTSKNCLGHEFTDRTSVHVHVDARDFSIENVGVFLLSYILVEPILYRYCGGGRHQNIFCVPLNMTNLTTNMANFFQGLEGESKEAVEYVLLDWPKYTGLNLLPLTHYGTIEFRHMVGNCDVNNLTIWINLLLSLHRYAKGQTYAALKERILNLNTSSEYRLFLYEVFGKHLDYVNNVDLENHMEDMVIFIKDIYSVSKVKYEIETAAAKDSKFIEHATGLKLIVSKEEKQAEKKRKKRAVVRPDLRERFDISDVSYNEALPPKYTEEELNNFWQLVLDTRDGSPELPRGTIYRHFLSGMELSYRRRMDRERLQQALAGAPDALAWNGDFLDAAAQVVNGEVRIRAPQFRTAPNTRRNRGE